MESLWCANEKPSMNKLERAGFRVVVPGELG